MVCEWLTDGREDGQGDLFLLLSAMGGSWAHELPSYCHEEIDLRNKGNHRVSI